MAARRVLVAAALCALLAVGVCAESGAPAGRVNPAASANGPAAAPAAAKSGSKEITESTERADAPAAAASLQDSEEETNRKIRAAFTAGDSKSGSAPAGGAVLASSAPAGDSASAHHVAELHGTTRHVMDVADKTPPPEGGSTDQHGQGQVGDKTRSTTENKAGNPTSATSTTAGAGCTTAT
jgi:hypothetical protein